MTLFYFVCFCPKLQLTPSKAAELKRRYGLVLDPVPRVPVIPATSSTTSTAVVAHARDVTFSHMTALKGIDVLPNGRYRVQLNTFMKGRKKFSRNSTSLYEVPYINTLVLFRELDGSICLFALMFVHDNWWSTKSCVDLF